MFQANQRIIEFLLLLGNLWSHLAWFTWLKIMTPTKNSINDNDIFFIGSNILTMSVADEGYSNLLTMSVAN